MTFMDGPKGKINVDERFISHGDLWINNIMVNNNSNNDSEETNTSMILDWQTLCPDHPVMDVGFLLCTSLTPENLDQWANDLIKSYIGTFQETCLQFKTEMPFNLDEFRDLFYANGVVLVFMFWMSAYEETIRGKPHYKDRFMWQLRKMMTVSPELFI